MLQICQAAEITRTHAGELSGGGNGCSVCAINYRRGTVRVCMGDCDHYLQRSGQATKMERCTWDAAVASNLTGLWENLAIDVGKEIILPNVTGQ